MTTATEMARMYSAEVEGKILTEAGLMRVARYEVLGYWEKRRYRLFRPNCRYCTIEQRHECQMILPSECPKGKARRLVSLDKPVGNNNGGKLLKLRELIADNTSIDLDAKLDARRTLQRLPKRLVQIGYKKYAGIPLEKKEKKYLKRWRKVRPAPFDGGRDHHDEKILAFLRKHPEGLTRWKLGVNFLIPVRKVSSYLAPMIKKGEVIEIKRESTRGRPPAPLLFIAGATIPEQKNVVAERDERIRQAYFVEGWSIKRINRELHHDKRTIRKAIYGIKIKRR